jgi:arsenite-transporting ATPase
MGRALFGEEDPTRRFFEGRGHSIEKRNGEFELAIPLPFTDKRDIELLRLGDELIVRAGPHKRNIILPRLLAGLPQTGARFEDGTLRVRFATHPGAGPGSAAR